jgi:putative membrane protein
MRVNIFAASFAAALIAAVVSQPNLQAAAAAASAAVTTPAYVEAVRASNVFVQQAGRVARERSENAQLRDFAQVMDTQHERMNDQIGFILSDLKIQVPARPQMSAKQQAVVEELRMVPQAEFDKRYVAAQIASHEEMLALHRDYAMRGELEGLRAYAADMVTRHEREVERARQLGQ